MTTLADRLEERRTASAAQTTPEAAAVMAGSLNDLVRSGVADRALRVGDPAPDFRLPDATGSVFILSDALRSGPAVISFYRGAWCPYCNLELRALQEALPRFRATGATLIAISPNTPDTSMTAVERHQIEYPVLSDADNNVAREFGLVFTVQDDLEVVYRRVGIDIGAANATASWEIPIPATYVIDRAGTVTYAFVETDYRRRAEPADVLAALEAL